MTPGVDGECRNCGKDPEKIYRCQICGVPEPLGGDQDDDESSDATLMADGGHNYHIRIDAPTRPDMFAQLVDGLDEGDKITWNRRSEPVTVVEIETEQSSPDGLGQFRKRIITENRERSNGGRYRLTYEDGVGAEDSIGPGDGFDARCHVQRHVGENGNPNGWGRTADVEVLAHVNPVESIENDQEQELRADGSGLPDDLDTFVEQADEKEELTCRGCGDQVERRYLENGECVGCRKRLVTDGGPRDDVASKTSDVGVSNEEGTPLADAVSRDNCSECGEPLKNRWNYCPGCGEIRREALQEKLAAGAGAGQGHDATNRGDSQ